MKNNSKKIFRTKKFEKHLKTNFGMFFIFEKKKSVEIRLIFEKKNQKIFDNNFCKFCIFEKRVG